jgi:hypothetical protein
VWFDIDSRAKFCLYVASRRNPPEGFPCVFGINSKEKLMALDGDLPIDMPISLIEEFSPEALALAEVEHPADISVSRKIYARFPKFGAEVHGLPRRVYSREVDMGTDRGLFVEDPTAVPVYEGRMVDAFDHRAKKYVSGRGRSAQWEDLEFVKASKRISPQWRIEASKVPEKLKDRWRRCRIGFCDVASPTNQRSLVAALIPGSVICGDKVPTILFRPHDDRTALLWLGVANSFCLDFVVRKKVALKMSYTLLDSLPLPRHYGDTPVERSIASRTLMLAATGPEMRNFWLATVPVLGLDPSRATAIEDPEARHEVRAELDVLVGRDLLGLTLEEMRYVLDPADILGQDCEFETFGALKRAEEREFGYYRSKESILAKWHELPTPCETRAA